MIGYTGIDDVFMTLIQIVMAMIFGVLIERWREKR